MVTLSICVYYLPALAATYLTLSPSNLIKYNTVVSIIMVQPDYALKHALSVMITTFKALESIDTFDIPEGAPTDLLPGYWKGIMDGMGLDKYFIYMLVVTFVLMVR